MAILTGFPPTNTISPSVRIAETDLSFQSPDQSFHRAGLVGFASKGPINQPTLVTSTSDLTQKFGYPHPDSSDPYMIYAAQAYLLVASELYVVRVGQTDNVNSEQATTASVDVPAAGGQIQIVSNVAGPYVFAEDSFLRFRLNGVLSVKTCVVLSGSYTAIQLAAALNEQLSPSIDGIQAFVTTVGNNSYIGIETTFAYGPLSTLELVSVQDSIYGGADSITGLGQSMTQAILNGTADRYPFAYHSAGQYDFTNIPMGANIQVVVDGTDNVLIDNIVQVIDLDSLVGAQFTAEDVIDEINSQLTINGGSLPGGFEAFAVGNPTNLANATNIGLRTLSYGVDARLRVKSDSTVANVFGFPDNTFAGTSPAGTSGGGTTYAYGVVSGDTNNSNLPTFTISADSPGQDGNATDVVITNDIRNGVFELDVYNNGVQVESWGGLVKDASSPYYVETFIALVSQWISIQDITTAAAPPKNGTYSLTGGSDGIPSDPDVQDSLLVGNQIGFSGLYSLSEPEQIDIDLIAIPGHSSTTVVLALLDFCQNLRQDCLAIIDPPFGFTVQEIVAWQNGAYAPLNSTQFDSDFGALYWPWVQIRDTYNGINVWAPPSGSVMATIARSDQIGAPWEAPAGLSRGIVPGITDVFSRPTLAERDLMYGNNNTINPIVQFVDVSGFVIWGQKTLSRGNTALNRVNVRRMLFVAEKQIRAAARTLLFEPNDSTTQEKFVNLATAVLNTIEVGRGLTDFMIVCDSSINTPSVIDQNQLVAQIGIQPTHAVEFILIQFAIFPTGTFAESDTGQISF
jgi:phage tail sheath protein FI